MNPDILAANGARCGSAADLADALEQCRAQTLRLADAYMAALPALAVPQRAELNPPLWELGHIGWFQEWWVARNPVRDAGWRADPLAARRPARLPAADALYDSSAVAHATRWALPLPDAQATRDYLAEGLASTLALLDGAAANEDSLYFYRLSLFHEDMHNEAAVYMANNLGFAVPDARPAQACGGGKLALAGGTHALGWHGEGFAFDNELPGRAVAIGACEMDAAPVSNARYAEFVEAGGYRRPEYWSEAGRTWLTQNNPVAPRFWRVSGDRREVRRFGAWVDLEPSAPACNLTCHEAEAWCAWAGRRLPTEEEWEYCATTQAAMQWGDVWEWTASAFEPYPGFMPHPYRDYSAPWFGSRRVLRGASTATHPRMRHPRYRNFFTPDRNDIFAGFRSCAD